MRSLPELTVIGALAPLLAAASAVPRGVGPEFARYYASLDQGTFTCISNPAVVIAAAQVNDNFCDCPDGSDEPATNACTHLSKLSPPQPRAGDATANTTPALPGYYCPNQGHIPSYLPFIYVNDGVCDYDRCCDGSDEWEHVGGVKCENRCAAIGKEWRKKDAIRQQNRQRALTHRDELVQQAAKMRAEIEQSMAKLQREIADTAAHEQRLRQAYEDVERRERGKLVRSPGAGKGGKTAVLAAVAKARVDELRESLERAVSMKDALKSKVAELEQILSTFKEEYNPNFNDEGVKRAVKAWEDYAAGQAGSRDDAALERDLLEVVQPDSDTHGINWAEFEQEEEESDVEALYQFEAYLPPTLRAWMREKLSDLRVFLVESGIIADNANSGQESKAVANARAALQRVEDELGRKQQDLGQKQEDLNKEYGPYDVFRALKGACVSTEAGEYVYEMCWLDRTNQRSRKGGGNTNMGNFQRIDWIEVDEDVNDEGKGLGQGKRMALKYENGQGCWNGPSRSTTVVLACAADEEIWKVVEEEKCVYRMEIGTPAVCEPAAAADDTKKDEL